MAKRYGGSIGSQSPGFISSVFGEPESFIVDRDPLRARKIEAALLSVSIHVSVIILIFLVVHTSNGSLPTQEKVVMINSPFYDLPNDNDGKEGGGGGGKEEPLLRSWGELPNFSRHQMIPPDPKEPHPLIPEEDAIAVAASVVMPIEKLREQTMPVGDISAPFNKFRSSGPGIHDGIGNGNGAGVGDGNGPGFGSGENGGSGGGGEGGFSGSGADEIYEAGATGLKLPRILLDPKPLYTEEARRFRIEGDILIQAIVRKDGSVDSFRILRNLGHGLAESAIGTIGSKWRFEPGLLNGIAVDVRINIVVSFNLH